MNLRMKNKMNNNHNQVVCGEGNQMVATTIYCTFSLPFQNVQFSGIVFI